MNFSKFWGHNPILRRKSGLCTLNLWAGLNIVTVKIPGTSWQLVPVSKELQRAYAGRELKIKGVV